MAAAVPGDDIEIVSARAKTSGSYAILCSFQFIVGTKYGPTNELDMRLYVNIAFGLVREISSPQAKNDRCGLICQRRQWDT